MMAACTSLWYQNLVIKPFNSDTASRHSQFRRLEQHSPTYVLLGKRGGRPTI